MVTPGTGKTNRSVRSGEAPGEVRSSKLYFPGHEKTVLRPTRRGQDGADNPSSVFTTVRTLVKIFREHSPGGELDLNLDA